MAYSTNDGWNGSIAWNGAPAAVGGVWAPNGAAGANQRQGWRIAAFPGDTFEVVCEARTLAGKSHIFACWNSNNTNLIVDRDVTSSEWATYKMTVPIPSKYDPGEVYILFGLYAGDSVASSAQFRDVQISRNGQPIMARIARDGLCFNASGGVDLKVGDVVVQSWTASSTPATAANILKGLLNDKTIPAVQQMTASPPSRKYLFALDDFITGLVADGVYAKLDALYLGVLHDAQAARVNLANPGTWNLTEVAGTDTLAPQFTQWVGYGGGASLGYLTSGLTASNGKLTYSNHTVGVYVDGAVQDADFILGTSALSMQPRSTTGPDSFFARSGSTTSDSTTGPLGAGLYTIRRTDSSQFFMDHNGVLKATKTRAVGTGLSTGTLDVLRLNGSSGRAAEPLKLVFFGQYLTTTEVTAILNRFNTYLTAIA